MATAVINLKINQGATFKVIFQKTDNLDVPINLTGYKAYLQARSDKESTTKLLDLTTEGLDPEIVITEVTGTVTIIVLDEDTALLNFNTAYYDLELHAPAGTVERWIEGIVTLSKEVTR